MIGGIATALCLWFSIIALKAALITGCWCLLAWDIPQLPAIGWLGFFAVLAIIDVLRFSLEFPVQFEQEDME